MKLIMIFCFVFHWLHNIQAQNIKIIEPKIGIKADLSENAANDFVNKKKIYKTADSIISTYPSYETAKKFLTPLQIQIWEQFEEYIKNDHFDISKVGCSWYCRGKMESIMASSALKQYKDNSYVAMNIHDFSLRSAWVEGVAGDGIGESVTFTFEANSPPITTVEIHNGYMKSDKLWQENSRVKELKLYVNGEFYATLMLKDIQNKQIFDIGRIESKNTELVFKFEIISVYKGEKYEDTCISEIEFNGDIH